MQDPGYLGITTLAVSGTSSHPQTGPQLSCPVASVCSASVLGLAVPPPLSTLAGLLLGSEKSKKEVSNQKRK